MEFPDKNLLKEVGSRVQTIEKLAHEIESLGGSVPSIAKNARMLLATAYVMKWGTSDLIETD
ncbi:MAG TPA: hypothetical protein VMC85_12445 [Desulfomonilaceae bacterium]|nr:hypothetical protein [Desulfomonilaceae bacterium]